MQKQKPEDVPFEQVGVMRFLGMTFRLFQFGSHGRMWIPLMDLSKGLGYTRTEKLYKLVDENPKLFTEQGWILDLKLGGELLPYQGSNLSPEKVLFDGSELLPYQGSNSPSRRASVATNGRGGPKGTLLTCHEGVSMCCMLNRSERADEFKLWAAKKLVPHMVRQGRRETPMDDWPKEERIKHFAEMRKIRDRDTMRKMITGPMFAMKQLIREVTPLTHDDPVRMRVMEMVEEMYETINGPTLFSKNKPRS